MILPRSSLLRAVVLLLASLAPAWPADAQEGPPATTTTTTVPAADESVGFESPRSTMRGYLWASRDGDWTTAAKHLDLRGRDPADGPRLARELKTVLDRKLWVDLDALSNAPEGDPADGQTRDRDLVGTIETPNGDKVKILVERVAEPDGTRAWKIARVTLQQLPPLWRAFGDGPLAEHLPEPFFTIRFLDVQLWQWIALVVLLLASVALAWLLTAPLLRLLRAVARRTSTPIDDVLVQMIVGPVRLAVGTAIFWAGVYPIWLALPVHRFVLGVLKALLTVAITWFALRLIDATARVMLRRYLARGQLAANSVVPLGRRTLKVIVALMALLAILQNLGFNVTGIIAGLGIGGLAVALAAQRSIENFFGGLSLIADHPVRVGDFCRFGTQQGTVEDIGLRSTRVRTLDRTVVTIPNADFATMQLENFGARDRFRLATTLGLLPETTPDQLRCVIAELKKLLSAHPKVSSGSARVWFTNLGTSALDIELSASIATRDADEFMEVREGLLLGIMDVVAASGTGLASPSPGPAAEGRRQKAPEARTAARSGGSAST